MNTTVKMQARGVLTLPQKARKAVGISERSLVNIVVHDGAIVVRPVSNFDLELAEDVRKSLEDLRSGNVSPAFSSMKEFRAYMKKRGLRKA